MTTSFYKATVQRRRRHSYPHFLYVRGNKSSTQPHPLHVLATFLSALLLANSNRGSQHHWITRPHLWRPAKPKEARGIGQK